MRILIKFFSGFKRLQKKHSTEGLGFFALIFFACFLLLFLREHTHSYLGLTPGSVLLGSLLAGLRKHHTLVGNMNMTRPLVRQGACPLYYLFSTLKLF